MDGEVALWRAVVHRVLEDGCGWFGMNMGSRDTKAREQELARRWFNPRSPDFCEVCANAGLDPEFTAERASVVFAQHDAKQAIEAIRKRERETV